MSLNGKGTWIWKIKDCEKGNPEEIAKVASEAGMTHVLIKIADGAYPYNTKPDTKEDLILPVVKALKSIGISAWGWHYVYGEYPVNEANIAISQLKKLDLDGYVIDAEWEYKEPGKKNAAETYMKMLRKSLPNIPIALSSYRFPTYHPQLPWKTFLEYCDINMPQVYWEKAHNPEAQLTRTVHEFQSLTPNRPVIPTGPTYRAGSWIPTAEDTLEFLKTSKKLNLSAANFFSWDECRPAYGDLWNTISNFDWNNANSKPDISELLISALNSGNPDKVLELYSNNAVHITYERTIQGLENIRKWYETFLKRQFNNCEFTLTGQTGTGSSRHVSWTCKKNGNVVVNGTDTIGLLTQKIAYHYTYFTRSL
ncbi:MAG: nuclear transport factor 2 family protein [Anaerolineaceae bacterium]